MRIDRKIHPNKKFWTLAAIWLKGRYFCHIFKVASEKRLYRYYCSVKKLKQGLYLPVP